MENLKISWLFKTFFGMEEILIASFSNVSKGKSLAVKTVAIEEEQSLVRGTILFENLCLSCFNEQNEHFVVD